MNSKFLKMGVVFWALLGLVVSCSHTEVDRNNPDSMFGAAEEAFEDERYLIAIEKYRDIKNRFPYSPRAVDAELRIADSFFAQESYLEAESAYSIFKELHPTHSKSDYVQYRIGLSFYNQIPDDAARDLSAAHRAIDAFSTLMEKYPSSSYLEPTKKFIAEARRRLAEYRRYVADFYFRRRHFLSASYRYAALLQDFPNLGYDEEALFRLGKSYFEIKMFGNARSALDELVKKYPDSQFKGQSISLLKKLEPKIKTN